MIRVVCWPMMGDLLRVLILVIWEALPLVGACVVVVSASRGGDGDLPWSVAGLGTLALSGARCPVAAR